MYYSSGEKDRILYNKPPRNGAQRNNDTSGCCSSSRNQQVYPAIPMESERKMENGRQVIYIRFATTNDEEETDCNNATKDEKEQCTNENCDCSCPNSKEDLATATTPKQSCAKDDGTCGNDENCECENEDQRDDKSWWKQICPNKDEGNTELNGDCKFCTVPGKNGEKVRIPYHHCFQEDEEDGVACNFCGKACNGHGKKLDKYSNMNRTCCGTYSGGWNKASCIRNGDADEGCKVNKKSDPSNQKGCEIPKNPPNAVNIRIVGRPCKCKCHK